MLIMVKNLRKGKPGAGAWHITARHRMDMALRHLGCHMGIIVKFSVALTCVKSPISRTSGAIFVVTCVENVLVRTPWKETWLELEMLGVETTKEWKVRRESDDKRVGRGWRVCRGQMWDCAGWEAWVWEQGKARVSEREKPMVRWQRGEGVGHGTSLPGIT